MAGAAFALAWLAARPLTAFVVSTLPAELSRGQYLEPDVRTFLFGCVASLAGFGLLTTLPVAVIRRASPLRLLQGHVGHLPLRAERVRHGLLVAQVTLTALLLYLSGLMVRSFVEAAQYDYGFDSEHVLLFTAPLPSVPPGTMPEFVPRCGGVPCDHAALSFEARFEEQQRRVFQSVDALHRTPGVLAAASLFDVPLVKPGLRRYSTEPGSPVLIGDQVRRFGGRPVVPPVPADVNAASANFVRALGARLAAGSSFDDPQHSGNEQIAVINESLARRLRPALGSADMWTPLLGQTLETRNEQGRVFRVVGVIRDLVYARPDEPPTPQIYFPVTSKAAGGVVAIRTTPSVEAASPAVRSVLQRMWGEDLSPKHFMLLRDAWHAGLLPFRGKALLVSLVGGFCVPLGAIGLIGALLYSVQVRTRETGIRIALGAEPAAVRRAVVLRALAIVTAGIVLGTACGVAAGRAVSHHLFNVHPADPSTIVGVASALLALAWCAALLPARRASRIDPAAALRHE